MDVPKGGIGLDRLEGRGVIEMLLAVLAGRGDQDAR